MAPRVIIVLFLTGVLFAVGAGFVSAKLSKTLPTDEAFVYAEDGTGTYELTMRVKHVLKHEGDHITMGDQMARCPAWYSSRDIHVLFKVFGWRSAQEYNQLTRADVGEWRRASRGIRFIPNRFNSYRFQIYRLTADPVRIRFINANPVSLGCGYRGRIPFVSERDTAIDVITDLLHLPRFQTEINLAPVRTPPRPPMYP